MALYSGLVLALMGFLLFLSSWFGERKPTPEKSRPYECGVIPTGSASFRYPVPFYLVAVCFLIFDVEAVFIFAWAVVAQDLGWRGWCLMSMFILILFLSLLYVWRKGGLDWRPASGSPSPPRTTSS